MLALAWALALVASPPQAGLPGVPPDVAPLRAVADCSSHTVLVDARCFGARPDSSDNSPALEAALAAAGTGRSVYLPAGTYRISRTLDVTGRRLVGELHWREGGTVLLASAQMKSVVFAGPGPFQLESITLDAAHLANFGLHTFKSHGAVSRASDIWTRHAVIAGAFFQYSMIGVAERVSSGPNDGDGVVIEDGNASVFHVIVAAGNSGRGLVIRGASASGGVTVIGGALERNLGVPVHVQRTRTPVTVMGLWIEHGAPTDGVLVEHAQHVTVQNCRISAPGRQANRAIRLRSTRDSVILGNAVVSTNRDDHFESIELDAASEGNTVLANSILQGKPGRSLPVSSSGRNFVTSFAQAQLETPPAAGSWRRGDIVWNSSPAVGEPAGWFCTGGDPPAWAALPALQPVAP